MTNGQVSAKLITATMPTRDLNIIPQTGKIYLFCISYFTDKTEAEYRETSLHANWTPKKMISSWLFSFLLYDGDPWMQSLMKVLDQKVITQKHKFDSREWWSNSKIGFLGLTLFLSGDCCSFNRVWGMVNLFIKKDELSKLVSTFPTPNKV